jgi:adenosylhomocysteine nucleosidase
METIGLIAAMPLESKVLLRHIKKWERTTLGPFRGARFQLERRDCLLITTGMGLKRAVEGTRTLLAAANPHLLVSFGIAGAVKDELHIGDVVVAGNTCLVDKNLPGPPRPLAPLSKAAWRLVVQILNPDSARLVAGTAITTRGAQDLLQPLEKMSHPILEMETAGIAQIAAEVGIPLVSIRSISDGPQAPIPFDLEAVFNEKDSLRLGKMLLMVLRNPRIISKYRQMIENSGIAADHAARAVVAVLNQPLPVIAY